MARDSPSRRSAERASFVLMTTSIKMGALPDLPTDVLIDQLLPVMQIADVLRLTCTSKFFALVCSDDTFWKRRLQSDFNFSGAGTARTSGWKFIYRGLFKPRVYVWGERADGRLGLTRFPKASIHGVPFPVQLDIPGARIVSLVAGGMSFHALDSEGRVHVWGTLDGSFPTLRSDGFSEPGKMASIPLRLGMPAPIRSISCGRLHASALDARQCIWTFTSWGRPFSLSSTLFAGPSSVIRQIECGWNFSSMLTDAGDVFVWWPFSGSMRDEISETNSRMDEEGDKKALDVEGVIPCVTWELQVNPVHLPSIPPLPELMEAEADDGQPVKLVQIAGMDRHIIGLTNKGHVLKYGSLESELTYQNGSWQYLPKFSSVREISKNKAFEQPDLEPPQSINITHISANFMHFIAYSSLSVLMGNVDTNSESDAEIIPTLQNRSVISVVLGDYHNVALTSDGKVLTWGAYSSGALGLGDPALLEPGTPGAFASEGARQAALDRSIGEPPEVKVPSEVKFSLDPGKQKNKFCFSIAAAGWHTGALVIDLEPRDEQPNEEIEFEVPRVPRYRGHHLPPQVPGQSPDIVPHQGIFRIGFAGRGRGRGL